MQLITKILEWDMGHRVPNHESKCRNLHGHRYKAEITLIGDVVGEKWVSQEWMVIDFSYIKAIAGGYIDTVLDHGYMFQTGDRIGELAREMWHKILEVPFVPTAENIAAFLYNELKDKFTEQYGNSLKLHQIKLYETPTSYVIYPLTNIN